MVMITVMTIMLTAAAEKWSTILRRDREEELIFRGLQYAQALADFRKEHGQMPASLEMLLKKGPKGHRYIRQLFPDPFSQDGKWVTLMLAPGGQMVVNPVTQEMRPVSMLQQQQRGGPGGVGQPIGPQTPQDFGLRAPRGSQRFPGRGQAAAPPSGVNLFRGSVSQISPFTVEQLAAGPIAGVASANLKEEAFKVYEGHEWVRDFWFTVFKFGPVPTQPGGGGQGFLPGGLGPGQRIMQERPRRDRSGFGPFRGGGRSTPGRSRDRQ